MKLQAEDLQKNIQLRIKTSKGRVENCKTSFRSFSPPESRTWVHCRSRDQLLPHQATPSPTSSVPLRKLIAAAIGKTPHVPQHHLHKVATTSSIQITRSSTSQSPYSSICRMCNCIHTGPAHLGSLTLTHA